ncbi:hypothetical protein O6H91_14G059300 [Diphasiastrum complanatum]|uniref:Uncharacterized protein n=1 Tax=Diphasiastrum complanatum TaxID=34168 RepID=A0ACC2BPV6_DIPCM|nr:hypothetical protein O6H91_Y016200 [Diphasiastrum complanatum]KAJ7531806.1 hypothetical protein O6H91_14G059300 [Diphasiastrum complanatum]
MANLTISDMQQQRRLDNKSPTKSSTDWLEFPASGWTRTAAADSFYGQGKTWIVEGAQTAARDDSLFAEDSSSSNELWPPRSYPCTFCSREFRTAQALGGHMNVHRRERAYFNQLGLLRSPSSLPAGASSPEITTSETPRALGVCWLYSVPSSYETAPSFKQSKIDPEKLTSPSIEPFVPSSISIPSPSPHVTSLTVTSYAKTQESSCSSDASGSSVSEIRKIVHARRHPIETKDCTMNLKWVSDTTHTGAQYDSSWKIKCNRNQDAGKLSMVDYQNVAVDLELRLGSRQ